MIATVQTALSVFLLLAYVSVDQPQSRRCCYSVPNGIICYDLDTVEPPRPMCNDEV